MRVLLADDQPTLRSAVRLLLEQEPGVDIVAEVADTQSLLAKMADVHPDVVLLDWELPGLNNTSAARTVVNALYATNPTVYIIVFSGRPEAIRHALAAGASSFVSKADPPEHLLAALRHAKG